MARVTSFGIDRVARRATEFLLERVTDLVFNDDGSVDGKGLDDRDVPTTSAGYHFGFYSRPKDGAVGVVVRFLGLSFLAAWRDKQFEMSLNKGECGMQNAFSASVLLDKNGNIVSVPGGSGKVLAGAASGTEPMVLGNKLETRLSDLEAKFVGHVHTTALGACTAGGATGAIASAATTSALPHSGDVIKSGKAEVAP